MKELDGSWLWVNNDLISPGYPCVAISSNQAPPLSDTSLSIVEALKGILFIGEDWQDCILAALGMSVAGKPDG